MKTSKRMLCLGIHLLAIGGAVRPASAQEPTSEFTTTDPAKVKVMEHFTREKDGVMDSFRHLCPGLGGYQVIHEGGDDRSWINLRFGGKLTDLYAATMAACPGHCLLYTSDAADE